MIHNIRLDLAYDGAAFHGWQVQPGLRTVQGELARQLSRLLDREARPTGAGRTDTGVHALGQVVHMSGLSADEAARVIRALPGMVPEDMWIASIREVSPTFHARFSACWRRYEYHLGFKPDVFRRHLEWQVPGTLDRAAMETATARMIGAHDFSSFCKTSSLKENNHCDLRHCRFEWSDDSAILHLQADRFLHHMVRTLVGTFVEIGRGECSPEDMVAILAARDRRFAGNMAPPQGLYLAQVGYAAEFDDPTYTAPGSIPEDKT